MGTDGLRKVSILDLPFVAESKSVFLQKHLYPRVKEGKKTFVVTANPEIVMEAYQDKAYFNIIKKSTYIIPDGIGIVYAAKIKRKKINERIPGVELVEDCLQYANKNGLSCCFIGASPEVNERLRLKIKEKYPKIEIKSAHHGYYKQKEEPKIIYELKKAEADFNFIALGYPRQEKFISDNFNKFKKGVFIGVGGSFDVLSDSIKRAPKMCIKLNLEWLYRLLKQPSRIFRSVNLFKFLFIVFLKREKGVK